MASYDAVGLGIASHDLIGLAQEPPRLGAKQGLAGWLEMGGGPVATALVTMARLGARTCLVSAVGDDGYGQRIVADLAGEGVDTAGVQVCPGRSHVAFVLAEPGTDRRTIWWYNDPAVLGGLRPERALIESGRALHLDTHIPDAALSAARWARAAGIPVMLDAERVRDGTLALLPHCDLLIVSERFGREVTGEDQPGQAALALHRRHGRLAIVTAGGRGSWGASAGELFHTPAFPTSPVDTTGCGDVFHGAFLYATLRGDGPRAAARFASAAAAIKCRAPGGRGGLASLEEVERLVAGAAPAA